MIDASFALGFTVACAFAIVATVAVRTDPSPVAICCIVMLTLWLWALLD